MISESCYTQLAAVRLQSSWEHSLTQLCIWRVCCHKSQGRSHLPVMFQNQLHLPIADGAQLQWEQSLGTCKRETPCLGPNTAVALGLCGEAPYHKTFTCTAVMLMEQTWKGIFRRCLHPVTQELRHRYSLFMPDFKLFPRLWEHICRIRQAVS